ncbi:uncharacterized protein UHO2_00473 [Ustilago hordei]|uniref:uncharacterized protein n=1 Tax=Ustilago hordei TaxID=120017 RepID=UPI001A3AB30F|nr:uncharacterized protein UHO2_00473 [Ustilago hordei]SYW81988.1 uncharacterized protein UHO2_00473 [Ustilago hordei]
MPPPNHSKHIESLEAQVQSLLAALNAHNAQESPIGNTSAQQGFCSKEPEAFDGEQGHLEPFLAQVEVFLWLNHGCFINNSDQILWLSTLLCRVAHQWFYPHLSAINPPAWLSNYSLFVNQLCIIFGDPGCIATAKWEIKVLSQTTLVANYLTHFHWLQMTLNWGEDTMTWFFYQGLKENVKDNLRCSGKPTELEALIQRSLKIDNHIAEQIYEKKRLVHLLHSFRAHHHGLSCYQVKKLMGLSKTAALAPQAQIAKHQLTALTPVDAQPPNNQYLSTSLCFLSHPSLPAHDVMIDSGATTNFIDLHFATLHSLPLTLKPLTETLWLAEGKTQVTISKEVQLPCLVAELFSSDITFQVTNLGPCPIILGLLWLKRVNPKIDWQTGGITTQSPTPPPSQLAPSASLDIGVIDATASHKSHQSHCITSGMLHPSDSQPQHFLTTTTTSSVATMALTYDTGLSNIIPPEYHQYLDIFSKTEANKLLLHCTYDHQIPLEEGKSPPFRPIYSLSEHELKTLLEYLEENLAKGFISPSDLPAASPILFVKKKDGSPCLCVDYHGLNQIMI